MKGGCIPSKNKFKTQKNKLRWLATDTNLNCYTLGVLSLMILRNHTLYDQLSSADSTIMETITKAANSDNKGNQNGVNCC